MSLLSIAVLGMFSLLHSVMWYNEFAETVTTATTLAQDKVEALKNTDYASITAGTTTETGMDDNGTADAGGIYSRTTTTAPADPPYQIIIKKVTVNVSWNWKGNQKDVTLKTMIKD